MNKSLSHRLKSLLTKKYLSKLLIALFRLLFITGICFIILYPILTKLSMSFMGVNDLYDKTVKNIPKNFSPDNYSMAFSHLKYPEIFFNTLTLSLLVSVLQAVMCVFVGYGFARYAFKFRGTLFALVIVCMVVPTQVIQMPLYLNFKQFGMVGNLSPFVLLSVTATAPRCGLYIFLSRQFFKGIPKEIDEAAFIDGAGHFKLFFVIMLKSAIPIMVTVFLFSFVWQWGENSYTGLFYSSLKTIASTLDSLGYSLASIPTTGTDVTVANKIAFDSIMRAAASVLAILPLLVLYVFSQRFFIRSVERTGIVG